MLNIAGIPRSASEQYDSSPLKQHGSRFETAVATQEGAGAMRNEDLVERHRELGDDETPRPEGKTTEKAYPEHVERS